MNKTLFLSCVLSAGLACQAPDEPGPDVSPGVSRDLARHRAATLDKVRYEVVLEVPGSLEEPVRGRETVRVHRAGDAGPLVLDFEGPADRVLGVAVVTGEPGSESRVEADYRFENGHVVVPPEALRGGENAVEIEFLAGDSSLNRRESFLYTLFVPDRAHHAFPCFDQPDLKARFSLTLETPAGWEAVANGPLVDEETREGRTARTFGGTEPLPTYLFAFAAGRFQVEAGERGGRKMRFFHRETDAAKVARNRDALFDLHATALDWLEDYTAIAYPFAKFDFVLVPGFQYGGMEHPGSIFYRDRSLLLDESATQDDLLGRASLIAHETAHMWFGDLVTMPWFDDVWMKEVFANFMAAKVVHPSFPEIDHELRFVLAHFPAAYEVDRSRGANPIRQELGNLNEAGSLYGAIIYQKAPIVVRHLELLMGDEKLREGIREYLDRHRFGNASWPDLVATLDPRTELDLESWSRVWVGEPGRPTITGKLKVVNGRVASLRLAQSDPWERGRIWNQQIELVLGGPGASRRVDVLLADAELAVGEALGLPAPEYVLQGALAYGRFELDASTRTYLLHHIAELDEPVLRGAAWLALWDETLEGRVGAEELFETGLAWLSEESDPLLVGRALGDLETLYWRYLPPAVRLRRAGELESLLWSRLEAAAETSLKATYYRTLVSTATGPETVGRLEKIWRGELEISGLPLAEEDYIILAMELAVRERPSSAEILDGQLDRLDNPDRRERFAFVMPALSADPAVRGAFFESLRAAGNREQERWVLEGLGYLHHPLRAAASRQYVLPALELLEEIQRTGDIFFPKRWLDATLGGYSSPDVAETVREFLTARPDYPERLRGKILQSADGLFRAAELNRASSGVL